MKESGPNSSRVSAWEAFWFEPTDPAPLGLIRLLLGGLLVVYLASWTPVLVKWMGPAGLLPGATVARITGSPWWRLSYFYGCTTPALLYAAHFAGLAVVLLMTVGWRARWTTPASLIVLLAYVHRLPLVVGLFETISVFLLVYLSVGPSGAAFSWDAWRRRSVSAVPHWSATVARRLMQIHLAALVGLMATTKLAGLVWWNGEAMWWSIARTEVRLVDLTFLHAIPAFYLVNFWTHAIVAIELTFPVLVWLPRTRRIWCGLLAGDWLLQVLVTGNLPAAVVLAVGLLAFADPAPIRKLWERFACRKEAALPESAAEPA